MFFINVVNDPFRVFLNSDKILTTNECELLKNKNDGDSNVLIFLNRLRIVF